MEIVNTTDYPKIPDYVVRRMVGWICRELEIRVRHVRTFRLRNRNDGFNSGRCWMWRGEILVSVGRVIVTQPGPGTMKSRERKWGRGKHWWVDAEGLRRRVRNAVWVFAHELAHLKLYLEQTNKNGRCERGTDWFAKRVKTTFESNADALLDQWLAEPKRRAAASSPVDPDAQRAAADAALLKQWERKQKTANTKVKKYRARVRKWTKRGLL